jgi:radical SAM protein with 4Fe4S-binding SPASM domain
VELERYQEFSARLHRKVVADRIPANATIEVTWRCPLACVHCYNSLTLADPTARRGELTREEHFRIVDEIVEAGCLWLLYTGGEPFARPDFLDIYTYAKRRGLLTTIFTNGTLITAKLADHLAEWRPFAVEITLYGRTRETYERVTRVAGSFDSAMRGIRLLLDRGLPLKLKTMALSVNKHEIWEMKRFAEHELGVEFKFDAMINPRIDCSASPLAVRLTPEEVVTFDLLDPRRTSEWQSFCEQFNGPVLAGDRADDLYHCGGGITSFAIDPDGRMSLCVLSRRDTYDLRTGPFHQGWAEGVRKVRARKITRLTKCVACEIKAMCGMCPANGELEAGDPESPVDFLCHVAHLRAHALGIAVPSHGSCEYCEGGERYPALLESTSRLRKAVQVEGPATRSQQRAAATSGPASGDRRGRRAARGRPVRLPSTPARDDED